MSHEYPVGLAAAGGGWIDSPAGALAANGSVTGKASFGFVSKYFKSAKNPKGETQFDLRVANFDFNALNYDYLVISGALAQYRGFGKVNGDASYNFILTAVDGQAAGGGGVDKLRIKIWNKSQTSPKSIDLDGETRKFSSRSLRYLRCLL